MAIADLSVRGPRGTRTFTVISIKDGVETIHNAVRGKTGLELARAFWKSRTSEWIAENEPGSEWILRGKHGDLPMDGSDV